ncbi:hypothetical protein POTOM_022362 [Populus tomentosa]|uniref:Uncharacterized protein n=1 Tax=Populus tomentosa TaxID=118781 RepID=A0A8X8CZS8_POPTO|nr:hypothetical protein POTOM_022362 [Populus tomentosa]
MAGLFQLFSFLFSACVDLLSGQAAAGGEVEGNDWLLLTKDVSPRCSRWSQVCRSAGRVADAVLMRTNWQIPGEKNKHGQGAVDTSLGFAKERGMSGLSLAKKGRKGWESVRLKREGKLVCRGKVVAEEGAGDGCGKESAGSQSLLGKAATKEKVFPSSLVVFFSSLSSHMQDLTFLAEHKLTVFSPNQEAVGAALPLHNSHHCSSPFLSQDFPSAHKLLFSLRPTSLPQRATIVNTTYRPSLSINTTLGNDSPLNPYLPQLSLAR